MVEHSNTKRYTIGNSWMTTLRRPLQSQGLEHTVLIRAFFSRVLHLKWYESITQFFSGRYSCHHTYYLCSCSSEPGRKSTRIVQEFQRCWSILVYCSLTHSQLMHSHRPGSALPFPSNWEAETQVKVLFSCSLAFAASFLPLHCLLHTSQHMVRFQSYNKMLSVPKTPWLKQLFHYLLLCCIKKLPSFSASFQHVICMQPQGS